MPRKSSNKRTPQKFSGLARFIVERIPGIKTLQLVKTIYFLEYQYLRKFGERLTEVPIIRISMGPVSANYKKHFDQLEDESIIERRAIQDGFLGQKFFPGSSRRTLLQFTTIELEVVLPIINWVKRLIVTDPSNATEIIKAESYRTRPMVRYVEREKNDGKEHTGGYVLTEPYFLPEDVDPLAEYRRTYRDHLKAAARYSVEDALVDNQVLADFHPFLAATNLHARGEQST